MHKIAVIGSTGLLGSNLSELYEQYGCDVRGFSRRAVKNIRKRKNIIIDFHNLKEELENYFSDWCPDLIINAVALVDLARCEKEYNLAYFTNVDIPVEIARVSKNIGSHFVHISTDHYYKDEKDKHSELDEILLLNKYAKTKYIAETQVTKNNKDSLIIRTNIIGFRNTSRLSFFEWLIDALRKEVEINLYTDFYTSPISVRELGEFIIDSYLKKLTGVYNIASSEVISKYDFGLQVAEIFGFTNSVINPASIYDFPAGVVRATNLGLDVSKIEADLSNPMPDIRSTIIKLYNEIILKENSDERE